MADKKAAPEQAKASAPAAETASTPAAATPAAATPAAASSTPAAAASSTGVVSDDTLETPWTFYFDKKLSRESQATQAQGGYTNYAQNLQKIGTFNSLKTFWQHYSYMQTPDAIPKDHNLYMFRNDLVPAWETFPNGGCWIIKVRKHNGVIARLWEELCFACVGEWFADPDVVGITLSTRAKDDNIAVWNSGINGTGMNASIGEKLKEILNLDESVEYKAFKAATVDGSTFRNAKAFTYAPAPAVPVAVPAPAPQQ